MKYCNKNCDFKLLLDFFVFFQQVAVISNFGTGSSQVFLSTGSVSMRRKCVNTLTKLTGLQQLFFGLSFSL